MYFYNYNIIFHDDEDMEFRETQESGICVGKTYSDAIKVISDYYDEDLIVSIKIDIIEDSDESGLLPKFKVESI